MNTTNVTEKEARQETFVTFLSSGTSKQLRLSTVLEINNDWINPCSPKFIKLLKLPRVISVTYRNTPITSMSQRIYGTTSLWYLIVACSGYLHQHEIPNGENILLPDPISVATALKETAESNVGKTIII